jgi:hypothetical protein
MYTVLPVLPEQTYANNMVTYGDIWWQHVAMVKQRVKSLDQCGIARVGTYRQVAARVFSIRACRTCCGFFRCLNRHGISPTVVLFFLGRLEIYDLKSVWSGKNTGCQANQSRLVQWTVNSCILQIKHMWNIVDLCACNLYGKIATIRIYSVTHEVFDSVR